MPNTTIQLKKSSTPSSKPLDLANGELAINFADGKLYYKNTGNFVVEFTGGGFNFGTVSANGTLLVSDTTGDVLTIAAGNNINITADAITDRMTIGVADTPIFSGDVTARRLISNNSIGDEGGEIVLATSQTNNGLSTSVTIDIYQNQLRFFETGGTNRGAFINLAIAATGVGTNLLATSSGTTDTTARDIATSAFAKANNALANTDGITFGGTLNISRNLVADRVLTSNNGQGENLRIGDDAWFGDTNLSDTVRLKGQQNPSNGYIMFGQNDGVLLGRQGSNNLTYGGNTVWHAGNDGAGSGLDADFLDGIHASVFANNATLIGANTAVGAGANAFASATIAGANTIAIAAFTQANNKVSRSGDTMTGPLFFDTNIASNTAVGNIQSANGIDLFAPNGADWAQLNYNNVNFVSVSAGQSLVSAGIYSSYFNGANASMAFTSAGYINGGFTGTLNFNNNFLLDSNGNVSSVGVSATTIAADYFYGNGAFLTGITSDIGPAFNKANSANIIASQAFDKANAANVLAFSFSNVYTTIAGSNTAVGAGANAFTSATVAGTNTIAIAAFARANTAANAFTQLTDVPNSYANSAGYLVTVNPGGTGLQFTSDLSLDELILTARVAPLTVNTDTVSVYVTASGTTPNREVATKIKNELGEEIILSSILV